MPERADGTCGTQCLSGRLPDGNGLSGRISGGAGLVGRLSSEGSLTGKLPAADSLEGRMPAGGSLKGRMSEARNADMTPATRSKLGGVIVGGDLLITEEGVLSVDKATSVEEDNTRPITAAAVYTEVGNINALLQTI